ncbi:putative MFS-type transporter [Cercospora beticola]|uniref:Putative MFS-type transporter n=1 Tax=Cercospora beticola TaxID=122368 RepID=A0A2G5HLD1_CERBT|nr:putative MFS-type transporter [Cercospora beticola]PIA93361.1 putative MFS-type transporter [Cercospora beticola]WPB02283.1 hypothetical protein RHO25_006917 [Cercospora beticola]
MSASPSRSWRTSQTLLIFTSTLGLFTENFLYAFVVPILPYMIEQRLRLDPAYTQRFTAELLVILGLISIPAAPIIGHLADQTTSRKGPLLISLLGCTIGTLLVASTISIWLVYAGRILQGIAGTGAWIIAFAMLAESAGTKHTGKILGLANSFVTGGIITGPAVSGVLLEWLGYWAAWSVPLGLLFIDLVARLAMVDVRPEEKAKPDVSGTATPTQESAQGEDSPLLQATSTADEQVAEKPARNFYSVILRYSGAWAAMCNVVAFGVIMSAFDATLPLHLRDIFGWGPASTGSLFLGLQIPAMLTAPLIGWLRDRIGLRWPTSIGWVITAPLLWFTGVPDKSNFLGVGDGATGERAFVATIVGIGLTMSLMRGAGAFQLTSLLFELKAQDPYMFGPGGGSSRMFSLTEISFNVGLLVGPILCAAITDAFGYYYTACTLATCLTTNRHHLFSIFLPPVTGA